MFFCNVSVSASPLAPPDLCTITWRTHMHVEVAKVPVYRICSHAYFKDTLHWLHWHVLLHCGSAFTHTGTYTLKYNVHLSHVPKPFVTLHVCNSSNCNSCHFYNILYKVMTTLYTALSLGCDKLTSLLQTVGCELLETGCS